MTQTSTKIAPSVIAARAAHLADEVEAVVAAGADLGDRLAAYDPLAPFNQHFVRMRIGRHVTLRMLDQDKVAETAQFVAAIGHHARF